MRTLTSILVPVDGSASSFAALEHAVVLAEDYDATITVLQVVPDTDPLSPSVRADVDRAIEDAIVRAGMWGAHLERRIIVGDPVREIVSTAGYGVDMIVMGTHGRTGRLHEMLGSVAEGVVRNAPCPVLTIREMDGGYQSFAERRHGRPSLGDQVSHRPR